MDGNLGAELNGIESKEITLPEWLQHSLEHSAEGAVRIATEGRENAFSTSRHQIITCLFAVRKEFSEVRTDEFLISAFSFLRQLTAKACEERINESV